MTFRRAVLMLGALVLALWLAACGGGEEPTPTPEPPTATTAPPTDTPVPPTDTPVPPTDTPAPPTDTPAPPTPQSQEPTGEREGGPAETVPIGNPLHPVEAPPAAIHAVDLLAAWVNAGAPETDAFSYEGTDGNTYEATFETDVLPLFVEENVWYPGAPACASCHHANLENANHEMDLSSYAGIMAGADRLEEPPGVALLGESSVGAGDYDWDHSKLKERLRNNRMPPGMPFDITEANRDGPVVEVNGTEVAAVDLIGAWVEAGAPEEEVFGPYEATFAEDVLPLFTEEGVWYAGSPACSSCHHGNLENAYHEMDLSSYEGILAGADRLEDPPGVALLGQSAVGESDYDWAHSKLRARLRNNRMPPGMPFDITEANRDGPVVQVGFIEGMERGSAGIPDLTDLEKPELEVVSELVHRGGCQACHMIPGIPDAVGVVGPPWCEATLEVRDGEKDLAFLYTSIVAPNAFIEEGFPANVMPKTFGELFTEDELKTLVAFISTLECED